MKKELKKLKTEFMDALEIEDDMKQTAEKIGIDQTKIVKVKGFKKLYHTRKALTISLASVLVFFIAVFFGATTIVDYINTPVYQGMEANSIENTLYRRGDNMLLADTSDEFQDEIEGSIGVEVQEGISYYATKEEVIAVTVKLDNPQFYEILSFTLNGRLYQTFEFLYGSNSNQIIVEFPVQATSGIEEITIDAIKYVDNVTIKNARFGTDQTIKIGVLYDEVPMVSNVSTLVKATTFGISFLAVDPSGLIDMTNGLNLFLFDGTKIVHKTSLSLGTNVVPYSNLYMGTDYQYAIVGTFDTLDGSGKKAHTLYSGTFTTEKGFAYENLASDYESVSFDINQFELDNGVIDQIDLIENEVVIDTLTNVESTTFTFDGLKSNTSYDVEVSYHYDILVDNVEQQISDSIKTSFTTSVRPNPTLDIINPTNTQESIGFEVSISDTNDLGSVEKVELFLGDTLVETSVGLVNSFDELLSNQTYNVVVHYTYDLVDGTGTKAMTDELEIMTLAKTPPLYEITNLSIEKEQIGFDFNVVDIDQVSETLRYELWLDGTLVETITTLETLSFTNLLSNNTYELRVYYQYDLNDGEEVVESYVSDTITTLAYVTPEVVLTMAIDFSNVLYVYFEIDDIDDLATIESFDLYLDGVMVDTKTTYDNLNPKAGSESIDEGDVSFNLTEIGNYTIVVVYNYDLNDGEGIIVVDENSVAEDNQLNYVVN